MSLSWRRKIGFYFVFALFMTVILLLPAQGSRAASIKTKSKLLSLTSVKISCTCGKGITQWKIRKGMEKSNGSTYYKTIKTLKKKQKSYTFKNLKKNTNYSFEIIGYAKKSGKLTPVIYDYQYVFTGISEVDWYDYALSDVYCSPKRIDLQWTDSNNGFKSSGYEIYRKKEGESKFKKIAKITKRSTILYKDKKVKSGASYKYRIRAYGKVKGKKCYSPYSDVMTRAAVYPGGEFTSELISRDKDKLVLKINSRLYNGDLEFSGNTIDLKGTAPDNSTDNADVANDSDSNDIGVIRAVSYSEDGKSWTSILKKDKVILKGGKSIYLTFERVSGADLTNGDSIGSDYMTYNHLPSFWFINIGGDGQAWYNMENIH